MHIFLHVSLVTRNGKIVWKHGLNWSFNALQNQAILELIVLYCDYCLFFFFFRTKYKYSRIKLCYNRLKFVKETQISTVSNTADSQNS